MAFRGLFFSQADEHLDVFAVDLHETGPSGGDVHWRGAVTGSSQASFEGLDPDQPGRPATHTYLQFHSMMLSDTAKLDAIPRCSSAPTTSPPPMAARSEPWTSC